MTKSTGTLVGLRGRCRSLSSQYGSDVTTRSATVQLTPGSRLGLSLPDHEDRLIREPLANFAT